MTLRAFVVYVLTSLTVFLVLTAIVSPESLVNMWNGSASWISGVISDNEERIVKFILDWLWLFVLSMPVWMLGDYVGLVLAEHKSKRDHR